MSPDRLRQLLDYFPDSGEVRWKVSTNGRIHVGDIAGYVERNGYRRIKVDGKLYGAHVIAWAMHHGEWPTETVDHENRMPLDNRISNLRLATPTQQNFNRGVGKNSTTGETGVWGRGRKFVSVIQLHGTKIRVGTFDTVEEARKARAKKISELGVAL